MGNASNHMGGIVAALALGAGFFWWISTDPYDREDLQNIQTGLEQFDEIYSGFAADLRQIVECQEQKRTDCGTPAADETSTVEPELETDL